MHTCMCMCMCMCMCAAQAEPVVDYLTRYSGLHPGDLDPSVSRHHITTMKAAYLQLRQLVDAGCRFVGHGLQKDFEMINVVVPPEQIVDTVAQHAHASQERAPRHSTPSARPPRFPGGPGCACACTPLGQPSSAAPGAFRGGLACSCLGAPLERDRPHRTIQFPRSSSSICLAPAASRYASSRGTCLVSRCPTGCRTRTIRSRTRALRCRRVRSMHTACTRPAHGLHMACTCHARAVHTTCVYTPCTCMCHVHVHVACTCLSAAQLYAKYRELSAKGTLQENITNLHAAPVDSGDCPRRQRCVGPVAWLKAHGMPSHPGSQPRPLSSAGRSHAARLRAQSI